MMQTAQDPTPQPAPSTPAGRVDTQGGSSRRTRVVLRQIGPVSVLKFSLLFYFCVMLIVFFALMIIYGLLSAVGAIDSAGRLLGYVFATGNSSGPQPVVIRFGKVFTWIFLVGCVNVVLWSLVNVFVVFLYNLISDVIGGIEMTLAEKR